MVLYYIISWNNSIIVKQIPENILSCAHERETKVGWKVVWLRSETRNRQFSNTQWTKPSTPPNSVLQHFFKKTLFKSFSFYNNVVILCCSGEKSRTRKRYLLFTLNIKSPILNSNKKKSKTLPLSYTITRCYVVSRCCDIGVGYICYFIIWVGVWRCLCSDEW